MVLNFTSTEVHVPALDGYKSFTLREVDAVKLTFPKGLKDY